MKVELLGNEAEVSQISPRMAFQPWHPADTLSVWFEFKEAVGSTLSFAIDIEAKDYGRQEFEAVIRVKGEEALRGILQKDEEARAKTTEFESRRKVLNKLTADVGDKLGIPYQLNTK